MQRFIQVVLGALLAALFASPAGAVDLARVALAEPAPAWAKVDTVPSSAPGASPASGVPMRVAVTCFKTGERTSGMHKICYYDCLGDTVAITIDATELCPLSIDR